MKRLLQSVAAAFFVLTGNVCAEAPAKNPVQLKREFAQSLDRIPAPTAKPTLTNEETAKLGKQVAACMKKSRFDSKSNTELELHLNRDGTVARDSTKIISAATPEIGRITLEATFQCQPYLLPAEKYDAWKAVVLVFVAGGGPK